METKTHLTKHELDGFEKQLKDSLRAAETTLKHLDEGLDFGGDIDHFDEEADEAEEISNRVGIKKIIHEKLEHVRDALNKIKKGEYGFCENCDRPIDLTILHAAPESRLCRECKKRSKISS